MLCEKLKAFRWINEPTEWSIGQSLEVRTRPNTDYWQRTHYGFQRDNGHFYFINIVGDFTFSLQVGFEPQAQYDQCGLMCRANADTWIKCSIEYETLHLSRLGSVVTNLDFSDWATQDLTTPINMMYYALARQGNDFQLKWSPDGADWRQMRITHLHKCPAQLMVGFYACTPLGNGFACRLFDAELNGERKHL